MYIKVRVIAGAKREEVTEGKANANGIVDHFKVSVHEPAERNLANERILEIFRARYPDVGVRLISGHHSPSKMLSIDV